METCEVLETPQWEFRDLKATDIFPIAKLISKIGIDRFMDAFQSEEVQSFVLALAGEEDESGRNTALTGGMVVLQIVQIVLENLDKVEADMFSVLASASNLSIKQIKELSMGDFAAMVIDFAKKDDFKDFFNRAGSLLQKAQ